ncbi:hypothetical protein QQ020_18160 [Fulvivirgaceae bacterium BMA12]|uniref:Uncharacterized protein n=1 Tax=Agaribacillus aureus TaxID=3051825 RepID=A0ABT8L9T2_9BACT|nr:hypothetical protein [Fulvivirgaceae bacterium BMA12]
MTRIILAGLSAIIIYGLVCLPGNALITNLLQHNINPDGAVNHTFTVLAFLLGHLVYSGLSGIGIRLIAPSEGLKTARMIGLFCMLAVSIGVTIGYWNLMPKWYHLLFFVILIPMVWLGTKLPSKK